MKTYTISGPLCWGLGVALLVQTAHPAETNAPPQDSKPAIPLADLLGFAQGLRINPKVITAADGKGTTFGLDYSYDRELKRAVLSGETDIGFSLHSGGLVVADESTVPNHVFAHGLRLSAIDLLPHRAEEDSEAWKHHTALKRRIETRYYLPWTQLATNAEANKDKMADLVDSASRELQDYGKLDADTAAKEWRLTDSANKTREFTEALTDIKERVVFLAVDLDGNVEHDQALTNVQFTSAIQLRSKLMMPFLDFPFELLRGGGPPKSWLNRDGGPHLWGGVGLVDGSENDARTAITTDHETFARAHFGVFYRTEILSISESKSVALEVQWRYYHEFNAPTAIRAKKLDDTSYFKATLLFPGNYFLEYTDGKLPLDVEGASTVSIGWRYNF